MALLLLSTAADRSRADSPLSEETAAMTARENPIGLDGFEFVEFTSPDPEALAGLFAKLGFTHVGNHRSKNVRHYAQGDINFILNMEPDGPAGRFPRGARPLGQRHGLPGARREARRSRSRSSAARPRSRARAGPASSTSRRSRGSAAPSSIWSTATAPSRSTTSISSRCRARAATTTASACTRSTTSPTM